MRKLSIFLVVTIFLCTSCTKDEIIALSNQDLFSGVITKASTLDTTYVSRTFWDHAYFFGGIKNANVSAANAAYFGLPKAGWYKYRQWYGEVLYYWKPEDILLVPLKSSYMGYVYQPILDYYTGGTYNDLSIMGIAKQSSYTKEYNSEVIYLMTWFLNFVEDPDGNPIDVWLPKSNRNAVRYEYFVVSQR